MVMNHKLKVVLTLILSILLFFTGKSLYQSYTINQLDVELYNNWIGSLDTTYGYLKKALDEEVSEPNDTIIAVQMYYRAEGFANGIYNTSLKNATMRIQGRKLDNLIERFLQPVPEQIEIEVAAEALEKILNQLPKNIKSLNDINQEELANFVSHYP